MVVGRVDLSFGERALELAAQKEREPERER